MGGTQRKRSITTERMRTALQLAKASGLIAIGGGLWIPRHLHACADDPPPDYIARSQTISVCVRRGWLQPLPSTSAHGSSGDHCVLTELGTLQLALFERVSYERLHHHAVRLHRALQQTQQYAHLIPDPALTSELSALLAVEL